jgi:biotin synthase
MERSAINALLKLPLPELIARADKVRRECVLPKVELCNILNAKSGSCSEDCKFCAQSGRHSTGIDNYPLKSKAEIIAAAVKAREMGAERFDIVTSGDRLTGEELDLIADCIREITLKLKIKMCASLGSMSEEDLILLKDSGLTRYHHNIETSERFFPNIVSTHSFQDRVKTIKAAKKAGLEVCSGGIIGMGEAMEDRLDMAFTLKQLGVDSVPINILVARPGTPLESLKPLSPEEAIRTIAIFRIILKDKIIKLAAGRESVLKDSQALAFMAGANGMLIGGYLTIRGRSIEEDRKLVAEIEKSWQR